MTDRNFIRGIVRTWSALGTLAIALSVDKIAMLRPARLPMMVEKERN